MLQKVLVSCLSVAFSFGLVYPQSTASTDDQQLQVQMVRFDNEAKQGGGDQAVYESLSKQLKIPVATLQSDRESTGFGFGQLFVANSLAQASGRSFDEIAQEFKSGKGWGVIAKENNLKVGHVVSQLKRANKDLKTNRMEHMQAERGRQDQAHGRQGGSMRGSHGRPSGAGGMGRGPHR